MTGSSLTAETTIAQALDLKPAIADVLIGRRTACVGCYMARFCTLSDSADIYGLPWDAFFDELSEAGAGDTKNSGGTDA